MYEEYIVEISTEIISTGVLNKTIFGVLQQISMQELSKRVIVVPNNAQTFKINRKIIDLIDSNSQI